MNVWRVLLFFLWWANANAFRNGTCFYKSSVCGDVKLNLRDANVLRDLLKVMSSPPDDWHISNTCASGWTGVCTDKKGRVTELYLSGLNFFSSIPKSFGKLSKLRFLEFMYSGLGKLPSSFRSLTELSYLDLRYNALNSSEDLSNIAHLTKLTHLDLKYNKFNSPIPSFLNLKSLQYLDLSRNYFTGSIPSTYGTFKNLTDLYLEDNQLCGSLPSNLGNLDYLYVEYNSLTGSVPTKLEAHCGDNGYLFDMNCLKSSGNCKFYSNPTYVCDIKCNKIPNIEKDLAYGTVKVKQSSTYWYGGAALAVDGSAGYGNFTSHSCTQTLSQTNPYWVVTLNRSYKVTTVQLYNRRDCCGRLLNGVQVYVGYSKISYAENTKCNDPKFTHGPNSKGFPLTVTCNTKGLFVWVVIPGKQKTLSLCEVVVFGS